MAIHTPCSPSVGASQAARVRRTAQMLNKFIRHGISVSAAPTKTPYATIEAANIGSAKASMRKAITPMMAIPISTVIWAKLRVSFFRPAPML